MAIIGKPYYKFGRKKKKKLAPGEKPHKEAQFVKEYLAKELGISLQQAKRLYPRAVTELLKVRPLRRAVSEFIEISPRKFRRLPPGKTREIDAIGPIVTWSYVERVMGMQRYWILVKILAEEKGLSIAETRKQIKERKIGVWDLYQEEYEAKYEKQYTRFGKKRKVRVRVPHRGH